MDSKNSDKKYCTRCKLAKLYYRSWDPHINKQREGSIRCPFREGTFGEFSAVCEHFVDLEEK